MADSKRVTQAIFRAVDEVNEFAPKEQRIEKNPETPLFGKDAALDSIHLVRLVIASEEKLQEEFGVLVQLNTEKAFSPSKSPFRTIGSFVEFAGSLLDENGDA